MGRGNILPKGNTAIEEPYASVWGMGCTNSFSCFILPQKQGYAVSTLSVFFLFFFLVGNFSLKFPVTECYFLIYFLDCCQHSKWNTGQLQQAFDLYNNAQLWL